MPSVLLCMAGANTDTRTDLYTANSSGSKGYQRAAALAISHDDSGLCTCRVSMHREGFYNRAMQAYLYLLSIQSNTVKLINT